MTIFYSLRQKKWDHKRHILDTRAQTLGPTITNLFQTIYYQSFAFLAAIHMICF